MNDNGLKEEKLWIMGSVIVGFVSSLYLYFKGDATETEVFQLGFIFSFLLWIATVFRRVLKGELKKGFLATGVKIIIIFAAMAGITSLVLSSLGVID